MSNPRSRFSRRHLLALCTFLVPLAVLAVLGQSELERQGARIQTAISGGAQEFLDGAALAFEQQIDQVQVLATESQNLLADLGAVRTTLQLREQDRHAALLDILVLDEQGGLVWPRPPDPELGLPFATMPRVRENAITLGLDAADLLLTTGNFEAAERMLQHLIQKMETAEESTRGLSVIVHFRLATVLQKLGRRQQARERFEHVRDQVFAMPRQFLRFYDDYGALAELALAEIGTVEDRIALLERIAGHLHYSYLPDGLRTELVERLVDGIPENHEGRAAALGIVHAERQRAQTRTFAGDYVALLRSDLRQQLRQSARAETEPDHLEIVATLGDSTTMLWVRQATEAEKERYQGAARVGLHIDLDLLMAPALERFVGSDGRFVLAVHDPKRIPLVEPPTTVPDDYVANSKVVHEMKLSVWPADADRILAEARAQAHTRFLLLLTLFGAAMAGALWLWRSVSREAELAALKVDLVSRVSHELKTPLALIRMYGETLLLGRARDTEQARHFGGIIARESERLTTMIQRILDFSRQQAGTLAYSPSTIDLPTLLHRICDAYTPHLEARGAVLVETVHGEARVHCDENACESAVVNMLENAAKYAIEGDDDHAIELDLVRSGDEVAIEVRDRGRGIPAAECEIVFDPFYRASNSGEVRGAGIGLSLVRHFARAHGGEATAAPRDGGGAVFRLTLPLAEPAPGSKDRIQ
ncbi:MAG: HAMP domain-containing histidine kinase [Planctomycetes bacterium]|nr:HAMP domain-containing histidine kinase [Planctomycetota bacterium]